MTKDFTKVSVSGICQAKKGLLFLRDCGAQAASSCHLCGRPICSQHTIQDAKGPECPDCVSKARTEGGAQTVTRSGPLFRTSQRHHYYGRYGYLPFYFGHGHYYSDRDYRTFDRVDTAEDFAGQGGADMAATEVADMDGGTGDFDRTDDFMES
ncbi:MAG: hypothetical protein V1742_10670 [Pseudomonadota bacterium]